MKDVAISLCSDANEPTLVDRLSKHSHFPTHSHFLYTAYMAGNPGADGGGKGGSGTSTSTIGIIAGCVAGGICVLVAAGVAALLIFRSRNRRRKAYLDLVKVKSKAGGPPSPPDTAAPNLGQAEGAGKQAVAVTLPFLVLTDEESASKVWFGRVGDQTTSMSPLPDPLVPHLGPTPGSHTRVQHPGPTPGSHTWVPHPYIPGAATCHEPLVMRTTSLIPSMTKLITAIPVPATIDQVNQRAAAMEAGMAARLRGDNRSALKHFDRAMELSRELNDFSASERKCGV